MVGGRSPILHLMNAPNPATLPVAATPLISRERDLAAALAIIGRPDVQLLTLTGPGGTG